MEKKNIDWGNLGFGYVKTDYRYVSNYKDGKWDEGGLTTDDMVTISECAGVLQYAQTVFEGMKAYTTEDGHIVTFRPDLNGERMEHSAARLEMPVFPKDRFVDAVVQTIKANAAYVPPYGSGATISSVYSPHLSDHTSKAALSRSQSVSATLTVLHQMVPVISKLVLTTQ